MDIEHTPEIRQPEIRRPAVAGTFYPSNPVELAKTVAKLFSDVDKPSIGGRPLALIAPHAGYPYSGKIAAKAFKLIEGEQFDTVVIISPSHTVFFKGSAVYGGDGYQTPLGLVETDKELVDKMTKITPSVYISNMGHASGSTRGEHALEVQLPFLQIVLGKFKLVAIVMGDQEPDSVRSLGEVLAATLKDTNALMVASTDLSHFHSEKAARTLDFAIQTAIEKFDPVLLMKTIESGEGEACGGGVVTAILHAARKLGATESRFLDYTTSGSTTGDFDEVVGYLAAVIVEGPQRRKIADSSVIGAKAAIPPRADELIEEDKPFLRKVAYEAIISRFEGREYTPPEHDRLDALKRGVFVTLTIDGDLRGCVGSMRSRDRFIVTLADTARCSAFEDPRFDELTREEFDKCEMQISVLSSLERLRDIEALRIGIDGLMIRLEQHTGLLLPEVASENNWDRLQFLQHVCLKAGLPKVSYRDKNAEIFRFTTDVF